VIKTSVTQSNRHSNISVHVFKGRDDLVDCTSKNKWPSLTKISVPSLMSCASNLTSIHTLHTSNFNIEN
jgi:hypothetical protein